ncbi:hypothetical protein MFFC18_13480 [Mariniblastus fucicola]|uniref:Uncharacterized protein n=1 Tax=Mariniblastus fucicola TaxID=980251 RepID=A0A5B9P995_9BACT|nr:hypothetical protein MFFC18_13480 [Mariniblastus fucicola]
MFFVRHSAVNKDAIHSRPGRTNHANANSHKLSTIQMSNQDEILDEIASELRRQNIILEKIFRKQRESTWYLWLIALIVTVSILVPFAMLGLGFTSR